MHTDFFVPLEVCRNFKVSGGGGSFPRNFTSPKSEPPPRPSRIRKLPIVPRGTHILFIFICRLEVSHLSASFPELQVFLGAAALFLATSLLRNPSRRPDLPESENLRLFHVEHTFCSHLNIGLKFTTSLQAHLIFKFFWGAAALFLATSPLRNPSRRPDLPESENLRLFHVEHTICSYLNIGLKFPISP